MGQPVVHFEVVGKDGARLQSFYSELFDWKIDANNPQNYGLVEGAGIAGGIGGAPEGYAGHVTFYVEVPDVAAALAQAEKLGGRRIMEPAEVAPGVEIAQFADPEGHLIGLTNTAMGG
jgi:predicted enzyme related to lactoylglutathione lyase